MTTKQSLIRYYQQILDKNAKKQDQTSIESASSILIKEFIEKLQELQLTSADEKLVEVIMKDLEQYLLVNAFWNAHLDCSFDEIRKTISKHLLKQSERETMELDWCE